MPRIVPGQAAELSLTMARAGFQDVVGYPDQANENSVPPLTVETSDLPVRGFAKNGRNKAAKFGPIYWLGSRLIEVRGVI